MASAPAWHSIVIPRTVRRALVEHAQRTAPRECCGLLVGRGTHVSHAVALANVSSSAVRYRIDPRDHLALRRLLRGFSPPLGILGVYHSHPSGRPVPSPRDCAEAYYAEWTYVLVGLRPRAALGAFRIVEREARRVQVR